MAYVVDGLTDASKETGLELNTFFSLEDRGDMFLQDLTWFSIDYMVLQGHPVA
jgi:hypothetical protein